MPEKIKILNLISDYLQDLGWYKENSSINLSLHLPDFGVGWASR
jgi:hypothetical protein